MQLFVHQPSARGCYLFVSIQNEFCALKTSNGKRGVLKGRCCNRHTGEEDHQKQQNWHDDLSVGVQHLSGLLRHVSLLDQCGPQIGLLFLAFTYGSVQDASVVLHKHFKTQSLSSSKFSPQTAKQPCPQTFNWEHRRDNLYGFSEH